MPEWELVSGKLVDNMRVAETLLHSCFSAVLKEHMPEIKYLESYRMQELKQELKNKLAQHQLLKKTDGMKKKTWVAGKQAINEYYESLMAMPPISEKLKRWTSKFKIKHHSACVNRMLKDVQDEKIVFKENPTLDGDLSREHER